MIDLSLRNLNPEKCISCENPIRASHPFIVCQNCDRVLHKRCSSSENTVSFRERTYCHHCVEHNDIIRYNPFYQAPHFTDNHLVEEEPISYIESIQCASTILENCKSYTINQLNSQIFTNSTGPFFSMCFLNVDGNLSNFDNFATQLQSINHKFLAIGLAETNTDPENSSLYQLGEYSSIYQTRFYNKEKNKIKSKGSGVCLYIHNSLNFKKLDSVSVCKDHIETLFVKITSFSEPTVIGVVYRPPNSNLEYFNSEYERILDELNGSSVYILGDFNIDILKNPTELEDSFQEILYSNGLTPTISLPTHQRPNCAKTCIDNIHTNIMNDTTKSGVIIDNFSHHRLIFLLREITEPTDRASSKIEKITIHYDYNIPNLEKLCTEIEKDIDHFFHCCDSFESFLAIYQEKIDATCRLLTPRTTKRNSITNPWITRGLINSVEKKARLYFEWKNTCTIELPGGDQKKHEDYSEYNRYLKTAIKLAKSTHYCNKFEDHKTNPKKTWQIINELRGKIKATTKDNFVIDGNRVTCRRVIANKFNEYFTSLASNLNEQVMSNDSIYINPIASFHDYMSKSVSSSIYLEDTNPEEIRQIIMDFKNGKASDIPIVVLKNTARLISPILSVLYNNHMREGVFPSIFKTAKVTPIYKKDNRECIENYRPVSILAIFGKIFEKLIYNRLYKFLSANGILHDEQFGFRKNHSTVHALHQSVQSVSSTLAKGKHVLGIFIDLSKAFDTLDHSILLEKLNRYGIRGTALKLMESYLNNRDQYVSFNNTASEKLPILYGVPQGSILGPLLFLLYMNDIINCYKDPNTRFVLYADDTNIFVSGPSKESVFEKANYVLEHVSTFMRCNLLHINMSKCSYIHFKPRFESDQTCARVRPYANEHDKSRSIFIQGKKIDQVTSTKFLGIVIDEKLNWTAHIQYLAKKIRSLTGALCRIRHSIPPELHLSLYNSLFESHLSYGISVWGVAIKDNSNDKLFIGQKHCIRVLFGDLNAFLEKQSTCARARPYPRQKLDGKYYVKEHTKPIFNRLKILTIQGLYKYFSITEIYKMMKLRHPYSLFSHIQLSRRDTSNAIILPSKSNTFLYKAAQLWNKIHKQIVPTDKGLTVSVKLIKAKTRAILLEAQSSHHTDQWTEHNFQIPSATTNISHFKPSNNDFVDVVAG